MKNILKKSLFIMFSFILLIALTGCNQNSESVKKEIGPDSIYTKITINDPNTNVAMLDTLLPNEWTYNALCNWGIYSTRYPGYATITLTSPDNKALIRYESAQNYYEYKDSTGLIAFKEGNDRT